MAQGFGTKRRVSAAVRDGKDGDWHNGISIFVLKK